MEAHVPVRCSFSWALLCLPGRTAATIRIQRSILALEPSPSVIRSTHLAYTPISLSRGNKPQITCILFSSPVGTLRIGGLFLGLCRPSDRHCPCFFHPYQFHGHCVNSFCEFGVEALMVPEPHQVFFCGEQQCFGILPTELEDLVQI